MPPVFRDVRTGVKPAKHRRRVTAQFSLSSSSSGRRLWRRGILLLRDALRSKQPPQLLPPVLPKVCIAQCFPLFRSPVRHAATLRQSTTTNRLQPVLPLPKGLYPFTCTTCHGEHCLSRYHILLSYCLQKLHNRFLHKSESNFHTKKSHQQTVYKNYHFSLCA